MKFFMLSMVLLCAPFVLGEGVTGLDTSVPPPETLKHSETGEKVMQQTSSLDAEQSKKLAFATALPKAAIRVKKFEYKFLQLNKFEEMADMPGEKDIWKETFSTIPEKDKQILEKMEDMENMGKLLDMEQNFQGFMHAMGQLLDIFDETMKEHNVSETTRAQVLTVSHSSDGRSAINTDALVAFVSGMSKEDREKVDKALEHTFEKLEERLAQFARQMVITMEEDWKEKLNQAGVSAPTTEKLMNLIMTQPRMSGFKVFMDNNSSSTSPIKNEETQEMEKSFIGNDQKASPVMNTDAPQPANLAGLLSPELFSNGIMENLLVVPQEEREKVNNALKQAVKISAQMLVDTVDEKLQENEVSDETREKVGNMLENFLQNKVNEELEKAGLSDETKAKLGLLLYVGGLVLFMFVVSGML